MQEAWRKVRGQGSKLKVQKISLFLFVIPAKAGIQKQWL